ncbi:MAG: HD-GYP domain-containing protein [Lachnospiraceae bacterium]|nr:HD-GYP domain-containing protein [Lachnospiraceae bacterium]
MKLVSIQDLIPGMRVGVDIYSMWNQLVVPKNTILTQNIIERLRDYEIPYIKISIDDGEPQNNTSEDLNLSYAERVKSSRTFKEFRKEFTNNIPVIQDAFNDVVKKHAPLDIDTLLEKTANVFSKAEGTNIFDMIHNMREYDDSTYVHCLNVSLICNVLGKWLNYSDSDIEILVLSGMMHDVGKLTIPDSIIKKPGKLTDEEYKLIQTHAARGFEILQDQKLPESVKYAALMHHERCDGSGYPSKLSYDKLDRFARLVSIADVYDAMTSARVYRDSLSPFTVVDIFEKEGLQKYDPECILVFLEHIVDTYLNYRVLLNDGRTGEIVLINKHALSRPLIKLEDGFLDLSLNKDVMIEKIL